VLRYEYGIGGEVIHRGYYCPSPIIDVIHGNCTRGRSVKKKPQKEPSYVFGFDKQNRLVTVEQRDTNEKEFLLYRENVVQSLMYDVFCGYSHIINISECVYDEQGRIREYSKLKYDFLGLKSDDLYKEVYEYKNDQLIVRVVEYNKFGGRKAYIRDEKYYFCISNGYIDSYHIVHYEDGKIKPSMWDGHVFKVNKKRKIIP